MFDLTPFERRKLLAYARRLTKSSADAEDLWQDTQISAWRGWKTFKNKNLAGWLYTIMHHVHATQKMRRKSVDPLLLSRYDSLPSVSLDGAVTEDFYGVNAAMDRFTVDNAGPALISATKAFECLTSREIELARAVLLEGHSYLSLAKKYGLTEHAVRQRLVRARTKMEKFL